MPHMTPLSERTHSPWLPCSLCGSTADKLTWTHIPPRAAFNDRTFRRAMKLDGDEMVFDSGKERGMAMYGHCEPCRAFTSPWDDEYIKWAHGVAHVLTKSHDGDQATHLEGTIAGLRPGRFARAALAGMCVLAEKIWVTHPDFVGCVRSGTGAPTGDLRFLMAVTTPGAERVDASGTHGGRAFTLNCVTGETTPTPMPSAVVHHPPFSLLLVDASVAPQYPHVDCTDWLKESADDKPRDLSVQWPVVHLPPRDEAQQISVPAEVMWPERFELAPS
jgi:hypothetical protein